VKIYLTAVRKENSAYFLVGPSGKAVYDSSLNGGNGKGPLHSPPHRGTSCLFPGTPLFVSHSARRHGCGCGQRLHDWCVLRAFAEARSAETKSAVEGKQFEIPNSPDAIDPLFRQVRFHVRNALVKA